MRSTSIIPREMPTFGNTNYKKKAPDNPVLFYALYGKNSNYTEDKQTGNG